MFAENIMGTPGMRALLALCLTLMVTPAFAENISRCVIEVDGKTWVDGPCIFESLRTGDGSFMVSQVGRERPTFAYVYGAEKELPPHGYWNGPAFASQAQDFLGNLAQDGACWLNAKAKVCAYRWPA